MNSFIPAAIAKAIADARKISFKENTKTNNYADKINGLADENNTGIIDVANLADENSGAIVDLAEYVDAIEQNVLNSVSSRLDEIEQSINALKDDMDMISHYTKLLEDRATNDLTGNVWTIGDVDLTWRDKVYTRIYSDGYYLDEDGTAYKANPT